MPHCTYIKEVGFGIYADTWFNSLRAYPVHAIGVASSANDPNAKAPISTFWKRPDVN